MSLLPGPTRRQGPLAVTCRLRGHGALGLVVLRDATTARPPVLQRQCPSALALRVDAGPRAPQLGRLPPRLSLSPPALSPAHAGWASVPSVPPKPLPRDLRVAKCGAVPRARLLGLAAAPSDQSLLRETPFLLGCKNTTPPAPARLAHGPPRLPGLGLLPLPSYPGPRSDLVHPQACPPARTPKASSSLPGAIQCPNQTHPNQALTSSRNPLLPRSAQSHHATATCPPLLSHPSPHLSRQQSSLVLRLSCVQQTPLLAPSLPPPVHTGPEP